MRSTTTRFKVLAATAACALALAACGGDDDEEGTAPGTGGDVTAELPDLSGTTVEVAAIWSGDEQAKFEQVMDVFEAETGAQVTYTSTGEDIAPVLGTRIQGGSPPEVALLPQPGLLNDLAAQGALQPLEEVAGDLVDEHFAEVWRELGTVDDTLYGVWFKAANKSIIWYNTQVFSDAGVEPPEDWEGLLDVAQTVSDSGIPAISLGGADGWTLTDWFENVYVRTAGADGYDQLADHEIPWTDESVTTALTTLGELIGNPELVAPNGLGTDFPGSVTRVFNEPPEAGMVYEGDFVASTIEGDTNAVLGEDADFFPFPSIDGSPDTVVGAGDVAVMLRDTPTARALIQFLASPAAGDAWAPLGGYTSPNQDVDMDAYPDEISRRSAEALTGAEVFRFDLSDLQPAAFGSTTGQGMWGLLQTWLGNPSDVSGIAAQLEQAAAAAHG